MGSYILHFPVQAGDPGPLRNIAQAVDAIAARTNLSAAQFKSWKTVVDTAVESGYSLNKALDIAAKTFDKSSVAMNVFTSRIKEHITEQKRLETQAAQTERSLARMAAQMVARSTGLPGIPGGAAGSSLLSAIPGGAGALLGVGAIAASTAALLSWTKAQADAARETVNLAEKTGLTIRETQLFTRSAEVAGVNANALVAGMRSLSRGLAEGGEEGKRQREVLDQLGIKYEDTLHRLLPVGTIIEQIGAKFATMAAGPARDLAANTLFGRGGLELIPIITRMKELGVEVEKTGAIMSDSTTKDLAKYAESLTLLGDRLEALKRRLTVPFADLVLTLNGRPMTSDSIASMLRFPFPVPGIGFGLGGVADGLDEFNARRTGAFPYGLGKNTRGVPTATDANVAIGNSLYDQFVNRRSDTDKRDLQAQLEAAKQKLSTMQKPQAGLTDAEQAPLIKAYTAQEKIVRSLQDRIEATNKLKQAETALAAFEEQMLQKAADPVTKIFQERDELVRKEGLTGGLRDRATGAALIGASRELAIERKKQDDQNEKVRLGEIKARARQELELRNDLDKTNEQALAAYYKRIEVQADADREIQKIGLDTRRQAIIRQADFEQSQVGSEVGSVGAGRISLRPRWVRGTQTPSSDTNIVPRGTVRGGPQSTVNDAFENRLALAKQLYDLDVQTAAKEYEIDKQKLGLDQALANQRKANALALKDLETQTADALLERQKQILKIQEEQRAQYENLAKGAFSALVQGGHRGLTEFVKQQFLGSASTVVGNLAGMAYDQVGGGLLQIPGQINPDGSKNLLGKMLNKTAFGIDPLKAAQGLDTNPLREALNKGADSTGALKLSVDALNNTIAFIISGGKTGSLPGGTSPASVSAIPGIPGAPLMNLLPGMSNAYSDSGGNFSSYFQGFGFGSPSTSSLPSDVMNMLAQASPIAYAASVLKGGLSGSMTDAQLAASGLGLLKTSANITSGFGDFSVPFGPGRAISGSSLISSGAQLGTSALGLINGLNTGGVRGGLQAAGGAAGAVGGLASLASTLGLLSPALGPLAPIAGGVAAALGLASSLFGDPKTIRQNQINKTLENQQFYAPVGINTNQSIYGGATTYDRNGNLRTTNLSPYPDIQEPYYLFQQHQLVPGRTTNYYGGSGPGQPPVSAGTGAGGSSGGSGPLIHIENMNAMDAASFGEFVSKPANAQHIAAAHSLALNLGGNDSLEVIRRQLGQG
jgi:hypothetical protein